MATTNSTPTSELASTKSWGIRWRVLCLVLVASLVPAILVGVISFLTAHGILLKTIERSLVAQVGAEAESASLWFDERARDTEVFASSILVTQEIARWNHRGSAEADEAISGALESYLSEVSTRYPLFRSLTVFDREGRVVASRGDVDARGLDLDGFDDAPSIVPIAGQHYAATSRSIVGAGDEELGRFVTVARMDELWLELDRQLQAGVGALRLFDRDGQLYYPVDAPAWQRENPGVQHAFDGLDGTAEYRSGFGEPVVGAFRSLAGPELGLIVEIPAADAFGASERLRTTVLLIALLSAALGAGLAYVFASKLTRPIRALARGADAVARGDLAHRVPHRTGDQLGELVAVFNRMTHRVAESHGELKEISITDELTGLYNRRHLAAAFEIETNRARRSERPFSVLIIDLDSFKQFNDDHGHLEGDEFLRFVGAAIRDELRSTDVAARFGGEEFVVLLTDTSKENARFKAEKLRRLFRPGARQSRALMTTVSIGIATWGEDGETEKELLQAADEALYAAKRSGRNRVVVANRDRGADSNVVAIG